MQREVKLLKSEIIAVWQDWRNKLAALSPRTAETYTETLKLFLTFHKLHLESQAAADFVMNCQQTEVMAWVAELYRLKRAPGTITLRVASLNSLFAWLHEAGYREKRLHTKLQHHDLRVRPTKTIPWDMVRLRIAGHLKNETAAGLELAALYSAMFYAALRVREALALEVGDLDIQEDVAVINLKRTKARKSAQVVISEEGAAVLWLWLKQLKAMQPCAPNTPLFSLHYHQVKDRFRKDFKAGCHAARKSAITRLLEIMRENMGDPSKPQITLQDVQQYARLSSGKMVAIYDGQQRQIKDAPGRLL